MSIDLIDVILEKCYCNNKCNKPLPICHRLLLVILTLASFQLITSSNSIDTEETLSILFNDLKNEGLLKKTQHKMVFVATEQSSKAVTDYNNEIEYVPLNDIEKQNSIVDNTVDFIITTNFPEASRFIERVLKTEGIVTVLINDNNPTTSFYKLPKNYKIVYVRQFDSVVVAMKKSATAIKVKPNHAAPRKLFGYASEAKKIALQNLEDVLLEPLLGNMASMGGMREN